MFTYEHIYWFSFIQIDEVISQAQATRAVLGAQRSLFGDVQGKVKLLSDKFPIIRGLLGSSFMQQSIIVKFVIYFLPINPYMFFQDP